MARRLEEILDRFIPPDMFADRDRRQCARIFLISHTFGPFIGNTVPIVLMLSGFKPDYVMFASITGFWVFLPFLRKVKNYPLAVTLSVENLIFIIFWGCFHYGGAASPFTVWIAAIPLLAFFYVGRARWMNWTLPALFVVNSLAFGAEYALSGGFPAVDAKRLEIIGFLSLATAACYVCMMALYYARILRSHLDLEQEIEQHLSQLQREISEFEQAGQAKSAFVANMSHELRTPLNAVIGYSELILEVDGDGLEEHRRKDLGRIRRSGKELLRLVNDVLDFSKLEAGKMPTVTERVDVAGLVREVVDDIRVLCEASGNAIIADACDVGAVVADYMLLSKALGHIAENAAKFTKNGVVVVGARRSEGHVRIFVSDTGPGIASEALPHVFDAFAAGDDLSDTRYGAAGVGLAIAKEICRLMGAALSVESTLGEGSTFTISLPVAAQSETVDIISEAYEVC